MILYEWKRDTVEYKYNLWSIMNHVSDYEATMQYVVRKKYVANGSFHGRR